MFWTIQILCYLNCKEYDKFLNLIYIFLTVNKFVNAIPADTAYSMAYIGKKRTYSASSYRSGGGRRRSGGAYGGFKRGRFARRYSRPQNYRTWLTKRATKRTYRIAKYAANSVIGKQAEVKFLWKDYSLRIDNAWKGVLMNQWPVSPVALDPDFQYTAYRNGTDMLHLQTIVKIRINKSNSLLWPTQQSSIIPCIIKVWIVKIDGELNCNGWDFNTLWEQITVGRIQWETFMRRRAMKERGVSILASRTYNMYDFDGAGCVDTIRIKKRFLMRWQGDGGSGHNRGQMRMLMWCPTHADADPALNSPLVAYGFKVFARDIGGNNTLQGSVLPPP